MAAVITSGTTLSIGGTSLTGVTDITPPSATRGMIDTTHLGSTDHAKEYFPGMIDGGEMSATVIVGAGAGIGTISGYVEDYGAPKPCIITLADSTECSFDGYVTKVQIDGIAVGDNVVKATIGVKPVGKITYSFD